MPTTLQSGSSSFRAKALGQFDSRVICVGLSTSASRSAGWNLFITVATALDASTPLTNPLLRQAVPNEVAGFPCDEELQRLRRRRWWESTDEQERARLADQIQVRAYWFRCCTFAT